ncbi:MAG: uncharacterized protein KVP18_001922 [Porospora cf. gigantea A]|uniref:uncharacterized protein n=1 Tax=Porospora cf. gigantea A TaxID=2853593 RepID=UPI003559DB65|nr:MAG: hypothetical protein KVP18_001922 [Porospora cf. gigantea A]
MTPRRNTTDGTTISDEWAGGWANGKIRPTAEAPRGTNDDIAMMTLLYILLPMLLVVAGVGITSAICYKKGKCRRGDEELGEGPRTSATDTLTAAVTNTVGVNTNTANQARMSQTSASNLTNATDQGAPNHRTSS